METVINTIAKCTKSMNDITSTFREIYEFFRKGMGIWVDFLIDKGLDLLQSWIKTLLGIACVNATANNWKSVIAMDLAGI